MTMSDAERSEAARSDGGAPHFAGGGKWAHIRTLPEFPVMLIGVAALIILVGFYVSMIVSGHPEKANHIWKIIGFHITGGAAIGTLKGSAYSDLGNVENIVINGLLTVVIIFLFTSAFNLSCRGLFHMPWLKKSFSNLKTGARSQKKTWAKFGIPGIFAFVIFPMTGTGPIIGSLLGRLIGLGFWTTIATVTSASLSTIVLAALFGDFLSDKLGDRVLSYIVLSVILLIILSAGLGRLYMWMRGRGHCRYRSATRVEAAPRDETNDLDFIFDAAGGGRPGSQGGQSGPDDDGDATGSP